MKRLPVCIPLIVFSVFYMSCDSAGRKEIDQTKLFSLQLGRTENELDLIDVTASPFYGKTRIVMDDGLLYVANGNAHKVMELNSYGDIVSLLYNPEENPEPVLLRTADGSQTQSSRRAVAFPFLEVGEIAVDSERYLIVEDRVADNRSEFDEELGVRLERIVRRFDRLGNYMYYLGQEGVGGRPFPYIHDIAVNSRDELVITCLIPRKWLVFWYSSSGELLYSYSLPLDALPPSPVPDLISSVGTLVADLEIPMLYVKIDYYNQHAKEGGDGSFFGSYIYWVDVKNGRFEGYIEVPKTLQQSPIPGMGSGQEEPDIYRILGMAKGGLFFLIAPGRNDQNQILIMDRYGKVVRFFSIFIDEKDLFYRDLYLHPDGVLVGLLCREFEVDFVWWRFDKYIQRYSRENSR